jgi:hypothetical protein
VEASASGVTAATARAVAAARASLIMKLLDLEKVAGRRLDPASEYTRARSFRQRKQGAAPLHRDEKKPGSARSSIEGEIETHCGGGDRGEREYESRARSGIPL